MQTMNFYNSAIEVQVEAMKVRTLCEPQGTFTALSRPWTGAVKVVVSAICHQGSKVLQRLASSLAVWVGLLGINRSRPDSEQNKKVLDFLRVRAEYIPRWEPDRLVPGSAGWGRGARSRKGRSRKGLLAPPTCPQPLRGKTRAPEQRLRSYPPH